MQIFFAWCLPCLLLIPGLRDTGVHYAEKRLRCAFKTDTNASVLILDTLLLLVLPGVITVISIAMGLSAMKNQRNRVWSVESLSQISILSMSQFDPRRSSAISIKRFHKEEAAMFFLFTAIFLRITIGYIIAVTAGASQNNIPADALIVLDSLVLFTYCLDPLFYCVIHDKFKTEVCDILHCSKEEEEVQRINVQTPSERAFVVDFSNYGQRNRAFSTVDATRGVRPTFY